MVALSLTGPPITPQKTTCKCGYSGVHRADKRWYCIKCYIKKDDEEKQEKAHDPVRNSNHVRNDFRGYLRHIMLHIYRWLGVTR